MKWFLVLLPFYIFAFLQFIGIKVFPFYSLLKSLRNYTNVNIRSPVLQGALQATSALVLPAERVTVTTVTVSQRPLSNTINQS